MNQPLLCCFACPGWRCLDLENLAESRFMPIMKMHVQKKHVLVDGVTEKKCLSFVSGIDLIIVNE